jgi:hypothetical protein
VATRNVEDFRSRMGRYRLSGIARRRRCQRGEARKERRGVGDMGDPVFSSSRRIDADMSWRVEAEREAGGSRQGCPESGLTRGGGDRRLAKEQTNGSPRRRPPKKLIAGQHLSHTTSSGWNSASLLWPPNVARGGALANDLACGGIHGEGGEISPLAV